MNNQEHELDRDGDVAVPAGSDEKRKPAKKIGRARKVGSTSSGKAGGDKTKSGNRPAKSVGKSKKDQLIALLSKPNGARVSVLVDRLGWQAHTVRAALSGLRKQGFAISTSKSSKTGETVYAIVAGSGEGEAKASGTTS